MKVTLRLVRLGCLAASSMFLQGWWPLASAQDNSSVPVDAAGTRDERLETELTGFLSAKSESGEQLALRLIEDRE